MTDTQNQTGVDSLTIALPVAILSVALVAFCLVAWWRRQRARRNADDAGLEAAENGAAISLAAGAGGEASGEPDVDSGDTPPNKLPRRTSPTHLSLFRGSSRASTLRPLSPSSGPTEDDRSLSSNRSPTPGRSSIIYVSAPPLNDFRHAVVQVIPEAPTSDEESGFSDSAESALSLPPALPAQPTHVAVLEFNRRRRKEAHLNIGDRVAILADSGQVPWVTAANLSTGRMGLAPRIALEPIY